MGAAGISTVPVGLVSTSSPSRLALIDNERALYRVLQLRLDAAGWDLSTYAEPPSTRELVLARANALVLDLDLAGEQRWHYLDDLVEALPALAIVLCTASWPVADRVRALRAGADHWVAKPCHPDELFARVQAAVRARRGYGPPPEMQVIVAGELEVRPHGFRAFAAGRQLELTRREFELLRLLAAAEGQVLTRELIYRRVWGYEMAHGDRSVDVFVRKLRSKLEHASPAWRYLHTHFGIGYRFAAEPAHLADVGSDAAARSDATAAPSTVTRT